jgi:hypothetical protein
MKILAISKEITDINWDGEKAVLEDEANEVYQLYLSGFLREIYFNEQQDAIIILECESMGKAVDLLNSLPLVKKGWIAFELMQINPYTGYGRIMKQTH